jgi:hypothetical protein
MTTRQRKKERKKERKTEKNEKNDRKREGVLMFTRNIMQTCTSCMNMIIYHTKGRT